MCLIQYFVSNPKRVESRFKIGFLLNTESANMKCPFKSFTFPIISIIVNLRQYVFGETIYIGLNNNIPNEIQQVRS